MSDREMKLECEVDLYLDPDDYKRHDAYVQAGATSEAAWTQVAQDILGGSAATVQLAEAVPE